MGLCHKLAPEKTIRLCLGGAFTKDAGQTGACKALSARHRCSRPLS